MIFKIKTSKKTMQHFEEISASTNLQPFILSKLAISLSLKSDTPLVDKDFHRDSTGLELNRQTITGEYDDLYKSLIEIFEGKHIEESEYFQKYVKAHLERGSALLYSEFRYNTDFIMALINDQKKI